MFSEVTFCSFQ